MNRMNFPHRKKVRQEEAEVRQEMYDKLSIEEKISRVNALRGNSSKQRKKLGI